MTTPKRDELPKGPKEIWYGRDPQYGTSAYCHSEVKPCHTKYVRHDLIPDTSELVAALEFEWRKKTDRYSNGETVFLNGCAMGEYFWSNISKGDKNYRVNALTPGLKLKVDQYDTIQECKDAVEGLIRSWFKKVLTPRAALAAHGGK